MTRISDIYNAITDLLEANLPGYMRMPNPYAPSENTFLTLTKGYGLAVGPATHIDRESCQVACQRAFTIILVDEMIATQNDTPTRELIEQELLNKHDLLRKKFYLDSTLGGLCYLGTVTGDFGINFIQAGDLQFLALEMTLQLEYLENPNT